MWLKENTKWRVLREGYLLGVFFREGYQTKAPPLSTAPYGKLNTHNIASGRAHRDFSLFPASEWPAYSQSSTKEASMEEKATVLELTSVYTISYIFLTTGL